MAVGPYRDSVGVAGVIAGEEDLHVAVLLGVVVAGAAADRCR